MPTVEEVDETRNATQDSSVNQDVIVRDRDWYLDSDGVVSQNV